VQHPNEGTPVMAGEPLESECIAAVIQGENDMTVVAEASNGREALERYREYRPWCSGRRSISNLLALMKSETRLANRANAQTRTIRSPYGAHGVLT
jgi:chemotaxis response regulator CheB